MEDAGATGAGADASDAGPGGSGGAGGGGAGSGGGGEGGGGEGGGAPPKPLRIMPLGDSITAGYTNDVLPFNFGWRGKLYTLINTQFGPNRIQYVGSSPEPWNGKFAIGPGAPPEIDLRTVDQDHHHGYGGAIASDLSLQVGTWIAAEKPDVILLMIGINQIGFQSSGDPAPARAALAGLLQKIFEADLDVHVVVAQITPYASPTPALASYNQYIRDVLVPQFASEGVHITTVDMYSQMLNGSGNIDTSLFSNGINHPNEEAYGRMATVWLDALTPLL